MVQDFAFGGLGTLGLKVQGLSTRVLEASMLEI